MNTESHITRYERLAAKAENLVARAETPAQRAGRSFALVRIFCHALGGPVNHRLEAELSPRYHARLSHMTNRAGKALVNALDNDEPKLVVRSKLEVCRDVLNSSALLFPDITCDTGFQMIWGSLYDELFERDNQQATYEFNLLERKLNQTETAGTLPAPALRTLRDFFYDGFANAVLMKPRPQ